MLITSWVFSTYCWATLFFRRTGCAIIEYDVQVRIPFIKIFLKYNIVKMGYYEQGLHHLNTPDLLLADGLLLHLLGLL